MEKATTPSVRELTLEEAKKCVCRDRNDQYGSPEKNFGAIADMWNAYLSARPNPKAYVMEKDVAAMMILLKVARIGSGKFKEDNWVDVAGYAACGCEAECMHRDWFLGKNKEVKEEK